MTQPKIRLLVATHNPGKAREYRELLADLPVEVTWLDAEGITFEADEDGDTFEANAILKASAYAHATGLLTWADDSGLEVDYLDGWPGIASARHAGPEATDEDRVRILLDRLKGVPIEKRTAMFRCVVALAWPDGRALTASGSCPGVIADRPAGSGGFGYDPVFYLPETGLTYAQLTPDEKHTISHRGRAARQARVLLEQWLASASQ